MNGSGRADGRRAPARSAPSARGSATLSFSATLPVITMAIIAGTKVSDRTKAATSAMMTVSAIGANILPSTP